MMKEVPVLRPAKAILPEARLYLPRSMKEAHNTLVVGFNRRAILPYIPRQQFLYVDDHPLPVQRRSKTFDVRKHCFNPLKDMDHIRASQFVAVLDAIYPEGASTLTRRYSNFILFRQLLEKPRHLSDLIITSKDPYQRDASERIERLLLSPVLKRVLNGPTNFSNRGTIVATLPRAEIGDFDAFVLGNLLITQYRGTVVVPDFGFYAHKGHRALIRQNRLVAGITHFDEVPELRNQLITIPNKIGSACTPEDAETLAQYEGISPTSLKYRERIEALISPTIPESVD